MRKKFPEQPERVLQFYDAEKQLQFAHFSAEDRLNWLASINDLYWLATEARDGDQLPTVNDRSREDS